MLSVSDCRETVIAMQEDDIYKHASGHLNNYVTGRQGSQKCITDSILHLPDNDLKKKKKNGPRIDFGQAYLQWTI